MGSSCQVVYTSGGGETQQAVISGQRRHRRCRRLARRAEYFRQGAARAHHRGRGDRTAEYYFVKSDSVVQKDFKGVVPTMTLAYSTQRIGHAITALRFMKQYGSPPSWWRPAVCRPTFTQVMSGQIDIGFSTRRSGLPR